MRFVGMVALGNALPVYGLQIGPSLTPEVEPSLSQSTFENSEKFPARDFRVGTVDWAGNGMLFRWPR